MSIDNQSIGAIISAIGWLVGLSMLLVGGSILGFAFWWARALVAPGLAKLFLRSTLAWIGIVLTTFGTAGICLGTEVALGAPFGRSSGGMVLFAYLLGLRLITFELATSHGLLRQLERRTDSGLHDVLAWVTGAAGALAWVITAGFGFLCFVTAINMALEVS